MTLDATPRRAGLVHVTGMRDDDGRLRCVLCETVMPERHCGISQDVVVAVSDLRSQGRAVFHLELRDEVLGECPIAFGPLLYFRCDSPPALAL